MTTNRFTSKQYELKHPDKRISDVTLEQIQRITAKRLPYWNSVRGLVKDDGRIILVFRTEACYEENRLSLENLDSDEPWFQIGEERYFEWSDDYDNYKVLVAEFWSEHKICYEQEKDIQAACDFYYGVKHDDGNYRHPFDVYSPKELL